MGLETEMTDQLQLRHWQQIKQAQALEYAGTPEGNAALAESRRYGLAADRIDELAAQVEVMHAQWYELMGVLADIQNGNVFDDVCRSTISRVVYVLAQTNTAADILRKRDARTLREAADICRGMTLYTGLDCADALNARADELEKQHG